MDGKNNTTRLFGTVREIQTAGGDVRSHGVRGVTLAQGRVCLLAQLRDVHAAMTQSCVRRNRLPDHPPVEVSIRGGFEVATFSLGHWGITL